MKSAGEKWLIFKTHFTELQQLILRIFAFAPQYFTPFQIGKLIRESNHDLSPITDEIKDAIRAMRECDVDVFSFTNNYSSLFQTEVLLELCDDNILESFYQNFIGPHLSSIRQWETSDKRLYLRYFYLTNKNPKELKRNLNYHKYKLHIY